MLGLGFLLGLRHALDADHVVAVSTIVAQTRNLAKAAVVGIFWGLGHTLTLGLVGLIVLFGGLSLPEPFEKGAEFLVGVVLVLLGASTLYGLRRGRLHLHPHRHDLEEHVHFHSHAHESSHEHEHPKRLGLRPLLVGMVHGLAGSAALLLLVLAEMTSPILGVFYILLFGAGSIVGMLLVSLAIGLPVAWTARSLQGGYRAIAALAGIASLAFGAWLIFEIGFMEGLIFKL